jgi:tetratricopeptide (TPR) repeat protein
MSEKEFPEKHWEEMRERMISGGPDAVAGFIQEFDDPLARRKLYGLAHQGFSYRDWDGKNFAHVIAIVEAGMAEGVMQAESAGDSETRAKLLDFANVLAYNLSADLAECWPGDETPREKKHFEKGLELAERCIEWRAELKKGPGPLSMAYWARAMHKLSLGRKAEAEADFTASLTHAAAAAREQGKPEACTSGGDFAVILGTGYLGLARWAQGSEEGRQQYQQAIDAFRATAASVPDQKEDAQFGLDQLRTVAGKIVGGK